MASKRPETMAKRARELAVKERRDSKRAKKAGFKTRPDQTGSAQRQNQP